ncbi:MAG: tryptophan 7-halogenase [Phycisphaerales bacterium]|nr:tryptophan 7-halogenase [Phycisphaerales bacterium]
MSDQPTHYDIAIIGGGPSGTTLSSLVKKYNPDLSILIIEKEKFPREHVGESQLPGVSVVLHEMEVWDKVEAANFPIKLGGSYTWGSDNGAWDFDFYPAEEFSDEERPAKYKGQRTHTAFQVERDRYDEILLRHAESHWGVEVREETMVREILREGDRVMGLKLDTGEVITATHYVDGSGHPALLRKAMGVESKPTDGLKNVAFWDYYDNATWAVEIGIGGTRVQVRSLPYGWIWFIPLGPSRASVGLICPSDYYKESGLTPKELFHKALKEQPEISELLKDAKSSTDENVLTTKNWSHLADRLAGENWWIIGEAGGFADPILAAGLTLAHGSARHAAYSILEIERGEQDTEWIKSFYDEKNRRNVNQHIRFAKYWYAANGCFTDLQEHCQKIAKDAGLKLNPSQAWRWLAQGGFSNQNIETAAFGAFDLGSSKKLVEIFSGKESKFNITKFNHLTLNLKNTQQITQGKLANGSIEQVKSYQRGEAILPYTGLWKQIIDVLKVETDFQTIFESLQAAVLQGSDKGAQKTIMFQYVQVLEAMLIDGWIIGKHNKNRPKFTLNTGGSRMIRSAAEGQQAVKDSKSR